MNDFARTSTFKRSKLLKYFQSHEKFCKNSDHLKNEAFDHFNFNLVIISGMSRYTLIGQFIRLCQINFDFIIFLAQLQLLSAVVNKLIPLSTCKDGLEEFHDFLTIYYFF